MKKLLTLACLFGILPLTHATTTPVVSVMANQSMCIDTAYVELAATATDAEDDDTTLVVTVDTSLLDTTVAGSAFVLYSTTDSDGLSGTAPVLVTVLAADDAACATTTTFTTGGSGGGGSSSSTTTTTDPEADVASDEGQEEDPEPAVLSDEGTENSCAAYADGVANYRTCSIHDNGNDTFGSFLESVQCEGFVSSSATVDSSDYSTRLGVSTIAFKMTRGVTLPGATVINPFPFIDVPSQFVAMTQSNLNNNIMTPSHDEFRPYDTVTRAEAYAMIMASVCLYPTGPSEDTWHQKLWTVANEEILTVRSWSDFRPNEEVLPREVFVIASRAADWAERTGGCNEEAVMCLAN